MHKDYSLRQNVWKGDLSSMNPIFFTSDLHFGHANIIKYCNRPFANAQEMNEQLIANWNAIVPVNGLVYELGDLFLCDVKDALNILRRLNGTIFHINGNHDRTIQDLKHINGEPVANKVAWLKDYFELKVSDVDVDRGRQKIVLFHYPIASWNSGGHGSWHLHGHCHSNFAENDNSKYIDCGVDGQAKRLGGNPADYRPMTYDEVKKIMAKKLFVPVDHHGKEKQEASQSVPFTEE